MDVPLGVSWKAEKVARMAALLKQKGFEVSIVPDLCEMAEDCKEALKALEGQTVIACHERAVNALIADLPTDQGHDAWFPIIDRDRCVDSGKCLDFCLFGVYKLDEDGRVQVTDPHSCKNNCPACARTCP